MWGTSRVGVLICQVNYSFSISLWRRENSVLLVATLKKPENRPHYVNVFGSVVLRVLSQEVNDVTKKQ